MTVLEVMLGIGWAITAIYWLVDHLFAKCVLEEYIKRLEMCELRGKEKK